jgi:diketogulonate reductase-like aldo/keto reductase
MRTLKLPSGDEVPALGQGTWFMGDDPSRRNEEVAALRLGQAAARAFSAKVEPGFASENAIKQ